MCQASPRSWWKNAWPSTSAGQVLDQLAERAAHLEAVINEHVRYDVAGERIVGAVHGALDDPPERVEIAGRLAQPEAIGSQPLRIVVLHLPFLHACFRAKALYIGRAARDSDRRASPDGHFDSMRWIEGDPFGELETTLLEHGRG